MFQNLTPLEQGILVLGMVIIAVELLAISSLISRNARRKSEIKRMREIMDNISEELKKAQQRAADEVLDIWRGVVADVRRNRTAPIVYRRIGEGEDERYEPYSIMDYILGSFYELFEQRVKRRFYWEEKKEKEEEKEEAEAQPEQAEEQPKEQPEESQPQPEETAEVAEPEKESQPEAEQEAEQQETEQKEE